jgi:protein-disulfide isomerase
MKPAFELAATSTLVVCALLVSGLVVRHEFFVPTPVEPKTVFLNDWRTDADKGDRIGAPTSPVRLMEFADFECPFCGSFHKTLKSIQAKYPNQIELTYVHFPIEGHRFAIPAARVAECANDQGRFEAMYDQLFESQDQFGLKPWDDYATAAGVPDVVAFDVCIKRTDPVPRVEEGRALGAKLDVRGTPTIIINGWKLGRPPTLNELDHMVKLILAGESPIGSP